jgi:predicted MPP superfamily phosphohydrolase
MRRGNTLIFLSIVILILLCIDWYAFQGVRTLTASWQQKSLRMAVHTLFWSVNIISILMASYGLLTMQNHGMNKIGTIGINALLTLFITQLVFILFLFGEDIYRGIYGLITRIAGHPSVSGTYVPERRKLISQIGILVAAVPFTSFIYGIARGKYNYKVHKHILTFEDLPPAFHGFTITQISDIHAGSFTDQKAVEHGIDLINGQKSDLFLFTGDLVNQHADEFIPWQPVFAQIKAPYGQYSILGNHDYGDYGDWPSAEAKAENHSKLIRHHAETGFKLMLDEHTVIEKDGAQLSLIGVQNWGHGFKQEGDLEKALSGIDPGAFKILMSHDPTHFEHQVKNHPTKIHLTLSGHTHGMQMGVEFPWLKWSPVQYRYPRWAGMYTENDRFLHINRGFGFLGFSGRVGIWPEITVIELRKA